MIKDAIVFALAHQQSRAESEAENAVAGESDNEDFIGCFNKSENVKSIFQSNRFDKIV